MVNGEVELLYPRDLSGNLDHDFASRSELPTVLTRQANRPEAQCFGGFGSMDDALRVSGSADCQKEVTGFAEGDDLLGKGDSGRRHSRMLL